MSKFEKRHRLATEDQQKLLLELCHALVVVKRPEEAANLLIDLFSKQEIEMVAKRLKIAKLLIQEKTYSQIGGELKVSPQTISRVNVWLGQSGVGYRLVIERAKDVVVPAYRSIDKSSDWKKIQRRYPMYFWPQILLEEVVRNANNRQRTKLLNTLKVLRKSGEKNKVFGQIEKALKTNTSRQRQNHIRHVL